MIIRSLKIIKNNFRRIYHHSSPWQISTPVLKKGITDRIFYKNPGSKSWILSLIQYPIQWQKNFWTLNAHICSKLHLQHSLLHFQRFQFLFFYFYIFYSFHFKPLLNHLSSSPSFLFTISSLLNLIIF